MLNMWKNYVARYNKFQWWLSGLVYGFYVGKFYQTTEGIRNIWNTQTLEPISRYDAALLTFEIKMGMHDEEAIREWLENRSYTLVNHTGFCGGDICYCKSQQVAQMADA